MLLGHAGSAGGNKVIECHLLRLPAAVASSSIRELLCLPTALFRVPGSEVRLLSADDWIDKRNQVVQYSTGIVDSSLCFLSQATHRACATSGYPTSMEANGARASFYAVPRDPETRGKWHRSLDAA
jgi:hypothetical protein